MGLLISLEQVVCDTSRAVFLGELSLDGILRHTPGVLPMVALAREKSFDTVFLPGVDAPEASLVDGLEIIPVDSLASLMAHLRGEPPLMPYKPDDVLLLVVGPAPESDLSHVRGQEHVRRALEVAAAGATMCS